MLRSAVELLGIVLLRFRPLPRVWAILLIAVNLGAVFFLDTLQGRVALVAMLAGALIMAAIHHRLGFVRLLGIGHILWIPMLPWMAAGLHEIETGSPLHTWVRALIVCNVISLIIDAIDVTRFLRGEREPYYTWTTG